jgi:hypothetical protein
MHAEQTCAMQNGPCGELAQPRPSSHWTHAPSSQIGLVAGQVAEHGSSQWPVLQTVAPVQSLVVPHSTQR